MPAAKTKVKSPAADPVLRRFCAALGEIYGGRIERVLLYGSRARGTAHGESDYDVAVFLRDLTDQRAEARRLADLESSLLDETGEDIQAIPFPAGSYGQRTPLMHEIRLDGIDLGPPGPPLSLYAPPKRHEAGMSPEAALYLTKARRLLDQAQAVDEIGIAEQAGRIAYAAAFNAAQALIFERGGRAVKTHRGVRSRFGQLTRDEPRIDAGLRDFLEVGFKLKRVADYFEIGDEPVSPEQAEAAIATATRFIEAVAQLLGENSGSQ
jgi:uncharacterized protein (UPF0332 family)/predicted nucleotidyltransferase